MSSIKYPVVYYKNTVEIINSNIKSSLQSANILSKYCDKYKVANLQILPCGHSLCENTIGYIASLELKPTYADFDVDFIDDFIEPRLHLVNDARFLIEMSSVILFIHNIESLLEFLRDFKECEKWDATYVVGLDSGAVFYNDSLAQHQFLSNI